MVDGQDVMLGHILKDCVDELADVIWNIFTLCLSRSSLCQAWTQQGGSEWPRKYTAFRGDKSWDGV